MTESELTRKTLKMLREKFPQAWIYKPNDLFTSGVPDVLFCWNGLWAIELKVGKNEPTKLQRYTLNKINTAGGTAGVCRSVDEVRKFLTKLE